jgi:hypothetical protein
MNSNWTGELDDKKSTYGYNFHLGSNPIFLKSKKKHTISLASNEVEYRGDINCIIENIFL